MGMKGTVVVGTPSGWVICNYRYSSQVGYLFVRVDAVWNLHRQDRRDTVSRRCLHERFIQTYWSGVLCTSKITSTYIFVLARQRRLAPFIFSVKSEHSSWWCCLYHVRQSVVPLEPHTPSKACAFTPRF